MNKKQRLLYDRKTEEILGQLSLEQKVGLMAGSLLDFTKATPQEIGALVAGLTKEESHYNIFPYAAGGLENHGIPSMRFCDGPRGVVCGGGESTCVPVTMASGATVER
ncbi:MAG: glycosyl hydrolase, partial [Lachnospiraceae bacterium]|nr:glycosyl hydrolase [Lachnospiraceae bacterium]